MPAMTSMFLILSQNVSATRRSRSRSCPAAPGGACDGRASPDAHAPCASFMRQRRVRLDHDAVDHSERRFSSRAQRRVDMARRRTCRREAEDRSLLLHHADDAVGNAADPELASERIEVGKKRFFDLLADDDDLGAESSTPAARSAGRVADIEIPDLEVVRHRRRALRHCAAACSCDCHTDVVLALDRPQRSGRQRVRPPARRRR